MWLFGISSHVVSIFTTDDRIEFYWLTPGEGEIKYRDMGVRLVV